VLLHPERMLQDYRIGAGEGMFAALRQRNPATTGGSAVFTGGRIRTPEPLRGVVQSHPLTILCYESYSVDGKIIYIAGS
jgi:hypothetical protein